MTSTHTISPLTRVSRKRTLQPVSVASPIPPGVPAKRSRKGEAAEMWSKWHVDTQTARDFYTVVLKKSISEEGEEETHDSDPAIASSKDKTFGTQGEQQALAGIQKRIASDGSLTPFRKHVLTLLCQVPRGRYTTYKALSDAVARTAVAHTSSIDTKSSSNSRSRGKGGNISSKISGAGAGTSKAGCARAVGMVMRTNPFAPIAPCHRVLTADGKLGGFKGGWGEEGKFADEKRRLLKEEGVRFDSCGKAVGSPFTAFV